MKADFADIVADVLGNLAFIIADDQKPSVSQGTMWMSGEIEYRGPVSGTVECWCTREFAVQLAANLLGTDPNDAEAWTDAEDAVCEFMNVLCGNLVTTQYGDEPVFNLTIPSVKECLSVPDIDFSDRKSTAELAIDGEPVLFRHCRNN